ncbi:DUF721 domain-containing protein [Synechococcus sp. CS-205]|uniref:DUF721 domain-containing protein n=1 Tax=Synechococcus sp. CS-205 TaxID=2847984 RepID=UPI00223AD9D9|nr:DUF721 domain-containing protein [Synechococcus sp. CS-205]MCT0248235.1 DUF721 domain-containing protein [Synechococcus sp. CS-205]
MGRAPRDQVRLIGNVQVLRPAPPAPIVPVASCLEELQHEWRRAGSLAALWQAWPRIAGNQLAPHCRPLSLHGGVLTVGAQHPQWLQALRYNRHQLLGALRGSGFPVRDLRFRQHQASTTGLPGSEDTARVWASHPSRVDVHGLGVCPACHSPAPAGELARWGHCGLCRRNPGDAGIQ